MISFLFDLSWETYQIIIKQSALIGFLFYTYSIRNAQTIINTIRIHNFCIFPPVSGLLVEARTTAQCCKKTLPMYSHKMYSLHKQKLCFH